MMGMMLGSCKTHKIFNAVVIGYSINMMNNFIFSNSAAKMIRHYKNILANITAVISIWMMRFSDVDIACIRDIFATFPSGIFGASPATFRHWHFYFPFNKGCAVFIQH